MLRPGRQLIWAGAVIAILALVVWGILAFTGRAPPASVPASVPGRNLLADLSADAIDLAALSSMSWADIEPTAVAAEAQPDLLAAVLAQTLAATNSPVLYLRGLLLLTRQQPEAALAAFVAIPVNELPPPYLYAPYRLQASVNPGKANPFLAPLQQAIAQQQVGPLIAARLEAQAGRLRAALEAYLRSDPAQWANYDLTIFRRMLEHAGLENETAVMLRAALKANRIPPARRTELTQLLAPRDSAASLEAAKARWSEFLQDNPAAQSLAVSGAVRQLELRRQFVSREYGTLLQQYQSTDPMTVPNETVLLLFLSSARERDLPALDRWSQELKRRTPTPEVEAWIQEIKAAAK